MAALATTAKSREKTTALAMGGLIIERYPGARPSAFQSAMAARGDQSRAGLPAQSRGFILSPVLSATLTTVRIMGQGDEKICSCGDCGGRDARGHECALAAGQQTWILVCAKSLPQSECNLTTASRWYHLPSPQPSATSPAIKAAKAQVAQRLEADFYVSQEQFPAGVSMGPRGRVFKACDAEATAQPTDSQEAEWARRGECLR